MACMLGLDVGTRRIGVARASNTGPRLASPLCTVERQGLKRDVPALAKICEREGATQIIVGLPYDLDGGEGRSARLARQIGEALAELTGLPVSYQDERFSTVEASARLRQGGHDSRAQRGIIDQAAAAVILQDWMDRGAPEGG